MTAFIAADTATPGSLPPRSPVAYTLAAPYSPSAAAIADGVAADERGDGAAELRALVRSSSVPVVGAPFGSCAKTQMFMSCRRPPSDDLQVLEERHDLGEALAVVLDDLAGGAGLGLRDADDALAGAGPADRGDARGRPAVTVSTGFDLAAMMPLKLG